MRTITLIPLMILLGTSCWAQDMFGTWKMNPARSQFSDDNHHPRAVTVRIEPHEKGEVFTYDRINSNGQAVTVSMIVYLDGKERNGQACFCSGGSTTQSSRRLDERTIEIIAKCGNGLWSRIIRRLSADAHDLILDMTKSQPNGLRVKRQLVFEKQG